MSREETIKYFEETIPKMIIKCRNTKIEFIKLYRLGKLYSYNETYRRLTGKRFNISKAYFIY